MGEEFIPVQEIARQLGNKVPAEFVRTEEELATLQSARCCVDGNALTLPFIDLAPLLEDNLEEQEKVKAQIGRAAEEWGFFQTINHGIPDSLLNRVLEVTEQFFNLPLEEKMVYAMSPTLKQGYGRLIVPTIRPWSDSLRHRLRPEPRMGEDFVPDKPSDYRTTMYEFTDEVVKLGRRLTCLLSEYLGLESNALQCALEKGSEAGAFPAVTITVNYYPKCPEPDRVIGIYPHSDAGAITVLLQDQVGGLQVLKHGEWIPVKPVPNALVVNISNQIQILSNGRLNSAQHRALANGSSSRLSIAAFCCPGGPDVEIGPQPSFVDEKHPPLFKFMRWANYLESFFSRDMDGKPLIYPGTVST